MSSRFLISTDSNLSALQDGSFDASLASLKIPSKSLNQPAVFDNGTLTERLLTANDMNFTVVSNPYRSALTVLDLETLTTFSLNDEIQKIDNFEASTAGNTFIDGTINTDIIKTAEIYDPSDSSSLQFSNTSIGVLAANFNLNNNNITQVNDITSNRFIVAGGTDIEYLLADGSTITQSANSGNSNFYLYNSINTSNAPPVASGNVEYNNANQSLATIVYISHLTRDNIDIEIFFQNVSTLNILYLQDQNDSTNYIRYDITGNATIVANSYISVPVSAIESSGTGSTTFGASHNILISIFTNTQETNTRLSAVETKTQNQSAVSNLTTFSGDIATSSQASVNTILGYVSNFGWILYNGALVLDSGSTISFIHKATSSYAITHKFYPLRNIRTYITFVLPDLTGLPNASFPENYITLGGESSFGIKLFRSGGILYLNFTYGNGGYNPIDYTFIAGDVVKIACDGSNTYYTLSGSNNINYTKSYDVGYPDYSAFVCGIVTGNPISSTNLTFTVSKYQITQQALECYDIIPTTTNAYDLGSTTNRFNNAYVNNLYNSANYNVMKRGPLYILTVPHTISNTSSVYTPLDFQSVMPPAKGILNLNTIPANTLEVGSTFFIRFSGTNTLALNDRLGIALYIGSTAVGSAVYGAWSAVTGSFILTGEIRITVQSIGISGSLASNSSLFLFKNTPAAQSVAVSPATINTTIANTLTARVSLASASAIGSCIYTLNSLVFEQLY